MDSTLTERIRERAYQIWVANGCRDGEAEQHWLTAEREILQSAAAPTKVVTRSKRTAAKKASRPMAPATPKAAVSRTAH
jgi:hypothetical protein